MLADSIGEKAKPSTILSSPWNAHDVDVLFGSDQLELDLTHDELGNLTLNITGASTDNIIIDSGWKVEEGKVKEGIISLGEENDTLPPVDGDNFIISGLGGDDEITTGDGSDQVNGNAGEDNLKTGAGSDTAHGGKGNDQIDGGTGSDWLYGDFGGDKIKGNEGNDVIFGNQGEDQLDGGDGSDLIMGGQDNDIITGGAGNDVLMGEQGNDKLTGGIGRDILTGDDGVDTFEFAPGDGTDFIADFEPGVDKIRVVAGGQSVSWNALDITSEGGFFSIKYQGEVLVNFFSSSLSQADLI